ncbi:hypothetical protein LUPAC06_04548 [Micromonospora saelicesensis]|nr:hypothetical protein LUPAC06_04548 [Micromonospora saelicesensis]
MHAVRAPGARVVAAQVIGPRFAFDEGGACTSVTLMAVRVSPPLLTTWNEYGTCCPTAVMDAVVEVFVTAIDGVSPAAGTVSVDGGEVTGVPPPGGVPRAVATLVTPSLSRSAWVTV